MYKRKKLILLMVLDVFLLIAISNFSTQDEIKENKEIIDESPIDFLTNELHKSGFTEKWYYDTGSSNVNEVDMSADGEYMVSGGDDDYIRVFHKSSSIPLWEDDTGSNVFSVAISDDGEYIVAGTDDDVFFWHKSSSSELWSDSSSWFVGVNHVAISGNGSYIVSGLSNGDVSLYQDSSSTPIWTEDIGNDVNSLAISADGEYIFAADSSDNVYLWHKSSSTPVWEDDCNDNVMEVDISDDGNYLVAVGQADNIVLWHKSSSTPEWTYDMGSDCYAVAISPDGNYILGANINGDLAYFHRSSSTPLWEFDCGCQVNPGAIAISEDGEYAAVSTVGDNVLLFNKHRSLSKKPLRVYCTSGDMNDVAISADGKYIFAGSYDDNVYFYEQDFEDLSETWNDQNYATDIDSTSRSLNDFDLKIEYDLNPQGFGDILVTGVRYRYYTASGSGPSTVIYNVGAEGIGDQNAGLISYTDTAVPYRTSGDQYPWHSYLFTGDTYLIDDKPYFIIEAGGGDPLMSCADNDQIYNPSHSNYRTSESTGAFTQDNNNQYYWDLLYERIRPLNINATLNGTIDSSDYIDAYHVNLLGGFTYDFTLQNTSGSGSLNMRLVENNYLTDITLQSHSGGKYPKVMTYTPSTTGVYLLLVQPESPGDIVNYNVNWTNASTPIFKIHQPLPNTVFKNAPAYSVEVFGENLTVLKYNLNDGQNFTIDSLIKKELYEGIINSTEWNALPDAPATINFYLKNSTGYELKQSVTVIKDRTGFDVIESVSSIIYNYDFEAIENNYFNIRKPHLWNVSSMNFDIETYHKNQTVSDPGIDQSIEDPWFYNISADSGIGSISEGRLWTGDTYGLYIDVSSSGNNLGFAEGEYGYWKQDLDNINPLNLSLMEGDLYQPKDETIVEFSGDQGSTIDFKTDDEVPYGGTYVESGQYYDSVDLYIDHLDEALVIEITPNPSKFGGNPSACWYNNLNIPYDADNAQITITWAIEQISPPYHFEEDDEYQVRARINNKYIDGTKCISRTDTFPYMGSNESLIIYNDPSYLSHDYISRTYNITDLIDDCAGDIKFDFGVWAKNPTHDGEIDQIMVKFQKIEIMYNTSNKYEIAAIEFDYSCEDLFIDSDSESSDDPDFLINQASLSLRIRNDFNEEERIILQPFREINAVSGGSAPFEHLKISLSQKYKNLLKGNHLELAFGLYFENDFYDQINWHLIFDNITFTINLEHDNVTYSGLLMDIDDSQWIAVQNNSITINTTNWSGEDHNFQFKTNKPEYDLNLYLNFKSNLSVYSMTIAPNVATASYGIATPNSENGIWVITYDNTPTYDMLTSLSDTRFFNLSTYEIAFFNLPAFDSQGANSNNWNVSMVLSPEYVDYTNNLIRFNFSSDNTNQSAKIQDVFSAGNWSLIAIQVNYITNCTFNQSHLWYDGLPVFYINEILEYNFTMAEDSIIGNYSISLYNATGALIDIFSSHHSSNSINVSGTIHLSEGNIEPGKYYFYIKWNDTKSHDLVIRRYGSVLLPFHLFNATNAGIINQTTTLDMGKIANITIYYRNNHTGQGVVSPSMAVYENSSGTWRYWGVQWKGTYQVKNITDLGDGNHTIELFTDGAPNGNYTIFILIVKDFNQWQALYTTLEIIAVNHLNITIIAGATWNVSAQEFIIDSWNIPYVNDTINSQIQINMTDKYSHEPIVGGSILGIIEKTNSSFEAFEIGNGLYNITLNTTGLNASIMNGNLYINNETVQFTCSKSNYTSTKINMIFFVDKIPLEVNLPQLQSVYAEGDLSILAEVNNLIDPDHPEAIDYGSLNYALYNLTDIYKQGSLTFLMGGIYSSDVSLDGLLAGNYSIYVNATAINCEDAQSNIVNFTIKPQLATNLSINIPSILRISKEFQITSILRYCNNGSIIKNQEIKINIEIPGGVDFEVPRVTDSQGEVSYDYIIPAQYEGEEITIIASYGGNDTIKASFKQDTRTIQGKLPIFMTIIEHPNNTARVGYSATYQLQIDINDTQETLQNRIILFTAYYENEFTSPFITTSIYTNENGICEYIISELSDEYDNLTVYFEYLGSETVKYNHTYVNNSILPKWNSTFYYDILDEDDDGALRYGEEIIFNMTFWSENITAPSFSGIPVVFTYEYGVTTDIYTLYVGTNNTIIFNYMIADSFSGDLNISIEFLGNNKISEVARNTSLIITDKIQVKLKFVENPEFISMEDEYLISVNVTDDNNNTLSNLDLIFEVLDAVGTTTFNTTKITDDYGIASAFLKFENLGVQFTIKVSFIEEGFLAGSELAFIKQKIDINLKFVENPVFKSMEDEYLIVVNATDDTNNTLANLNLIFEVLDAGGETTYSTISITDIDGIATALLKFADLGTRFTIKVSFIDEGVFASSELQFLKEKVEIIIKFIEEPDLEYMEGTYTFFISVTDSDMNPLEKIEIIFELVDENGIIVFDASATSNSKGQASVSLNFEKIGVAFTIRVRIIDKGVFAGSEIVSKEFQIKNEWVVFLEFLPYILIGVAIAIGILFAINRTVIIPKRDRKRELLKIMYQKLSDVENLQYIMILTKKGGVSVFSKSLADVPIDGVLVSGFLSAISTFGAEIGAKMRDKKGEGGLEELSYRQFKIILSQGTLVNTALLLLKRPNESLKAKLKLFNTVFEDAFKDVLIDWKGELLRENTVDLLIEEIFEADLLYPHHLIENKVNEYIKDLSNRDLNKKIIVLAISEEFESNFYLRDMINHLKTTGIEEVKSFESLEKLKKDKIVFAINPRTNYLIEQYYPYIKDLNFDDRSVLFAIFDGITDEIYVRKYLQINKLTLSEGADIRFIFQKLQDMKLIGRDNVINETGNIVATLLKLLPDL